MSDDRKLAKWALVLGAVVFLALFFVAPWVANR